MSRRRSSGPARHESPGFGPPRRRFGQNFLASQGVARKIVAAAGVEGRRVVEIGPGRGALTELLAEAASELVLVEIDRDLAASLVRRFHGAAVRVVEGDALEARFDDLLPADGETIVVSNLPYNVATPILARLVPRNDLFRKLVVMVQLEVAQRITAKPGTKSYGALTIFLGRFARSRMLFRVPPGAFHPAPQVTSAVVEVVSREVPEVVPADVDVFERVVRAAFEQRRKTLRRALAALLPEGDIAACGVDPARRGETLSIEEFARLADRAAARIEGA